MTDETLRLARIKLKLERRAHVFNLTRSFFRDLGYLEVDTPVRVPTIAPEANILPVESMGCYLAASPELHMKRLLAAGYERIFQISRCFRQGERGPLHNPEFSLLEWYRVGANYMDMIDDTARLVCYIARELDCRQLIAYQSGAIRLELPWPVFPIETLFREFAGWNPVENYDAARFDIDLVTKVLPGLPSDKPVILTDYPAEAGSLARLKPGNPRVAERAEVFIGGLELANAYSELNDDIEQRQRFALEIAAIKSESGREIQMPESFLKALGHMPECGGIALGMDRLAMLFCDAAAIDEVLAFTSENA